MASNLWLPAGIGLHLASVLVALAWHRDRLETLPLLGPLLARVDAIVSEMRSGHVWGLSLGLFATFATFALTIGPQTFVADPRTYQGALERLLDGSNPYVDGPPTGGAPAYTGVFILWMLPFYALLGDPGVYVATGAIATLLPPLTWRLGRLYASRRVAAYAATLTATAPLTIMFAHRIASEETFVAALAVLVVLLFAAERARSASLVGGALAVKFVSLVPMLAWLYIAARRPRARQRLLRLTGLTLLTVVGYLAVFAPSYLAWNGPYVHEVYVEQTFQRLGQPRPSVNVLGIFETLGHAPPPTWLVGPVLLAGAASLTLYTLKDPRDMVLAGALVFAVLLLVIPSVAKEWIVWGLPLMLLGSLKFSDPRRLWSPLLPVALVATSHAYTFTRYRLGEPLVLIPLAIAFTVGLLVVAYHAVCHQRFGAGD